MQIVRAYVCMKISEYPPPPTHTHTHPPPGLYTEQLAEPNNPENHAGMFMY